MKAVKISGEAYDELVKLSQQLNTPISDLATKAVMLFIQGNALNPEADEIKDITEKFITLRYPYKCKGCGTQLEPGTEAYYVKYEYSNQPPKTLIYCMSCYYEKMLSDKVLAKLYVKKRELELIIRHLKAKANKLADYTIIMEKLNEVAETLSKARDNVEKFSHEVLVSLDINSYREHYEILKQINEELGKLIENIYALRILRPPIKKQKVIKFR